jgi:Peptidase A4 family
MWYGFPHSIPRIDFSRKHTAITVISSGQLDRKGVPVRKLVFGFVVVVVLLAFPAVAGAKVGGGGTILRHGPIKKLTQSTSTNWAGYAAVGGGFTKVTSTWTQPSATCGSATTYSSFWVGLDGDGSNTVEQTGTEADCSGGHASYSAWYEMYPKYPVYLNISVQPGNSFTATVAVSSRGRYTLTLKNNSTGATFTTTQKGRGANYSAEAIAEAPSSRSGVLPLTNFGTANFSNTRVNDSPIGNFTYDRIDMASGSTLKAQTSGLSGGTNFGVTWKHS